MTTALRDGELHRIELRGPGTVARALVDAELEDTLRAAGLLEIDGLAKARAVGALTPGAGRSPGLLLALPDRSDRLHLRLARRGGLFAPLLGERLWSPARVFDELEVAVRLLRDGAPTPRAVLAMARRERGRWTAALGTLYVEDSLDGCRLLSEHGSTASRAPALRAAARAVRRFHDAGGRHRDLHIGNLLFRGIASGREPEVWVIDLDGAGIGAPPSPARRMRELMRLYRSLRKRGWHTRLGRDGCANFLETYADGDEALRRRMLRSLPLERARVRLHALAYRR